VPVGGGEDRVEDLPFLDLCGRLIVPREEVGAVGRRRGCEGTRSAVVRDLEERAVAVVSRARAAGLDRGPTIRK
jgi:hypothetical protein